jgi:hypothetical protein
VLKYMKDSGSPSADMVALDAGGLMILLVGILLLWRGSDVVTHKPLIQGSGAMN